MIVNCCQDPIYIYIYIYISDIYIYIYIYMSEITKKRELSYTFLYTRDPGWGWPDFGSASVSGSRSDPPE